MNIDVGARPRSRDRRRAILDAAADLFLENGFGATTVDMIVERAGASKATLYKFFSTKEDLFAAMVEAAVGDIVRPLPDVARLDLALEDTLLTIAREHLRAVLSPRHINIVRLVAGESARFPELGALYHRLGPASGHRKLEAYLEDQAARGALGIGDVGRAASYFYGMLLHKATLERLYGVAAPPPDDALEREARRVVADFLTLYGARGATA